MAKIQINLTEEEISVNAGLIGATFNVLSSSYATTASYALNSSGGSAIISSKELYVSANGVGTNQFTTISGALASFNTGDTIVLAPETFNEDVTISKDNVKIIGTHKDSSIINGLSISGKDFSINNVHISGTLLISCSTGFNFHKSSKFNDCKFSGNVFIGSSSYSNNYGLEFNKCRFDGINKTLISNNNSSWFRTWMFDCIIQPADLSATSSFSSQSYNIDCYNGNLEFDDCPLLKINNITFKNNVSGSQVSMQQSYAIIETMINEITGSNFGVFAFRNGNLAFMQPVTCSYKFEFDIERSRLALHDGGLKYDASTASRFINVEQVGWGSLAYITGSQLSQLYIMNSTWGMSSSLGLGADIGNVWNGFIDS